MDIKSKVTTKVADDTDTNNIIQNPRFEHGISNWSGKACEIFVLRDSVADKKFKPLLSGIFFAVATGRTNFWNGIEQDITSRVQINVAYNFSAVVRIYGNNVSSADVRATLWVQAPGGTELNFVCNVANSQATDNDWITLRGEFMVEGTPSKVVVLLEDPPCGVDIIVNSVTVNPKV